MSQGSTDTDSSAASSIQVFRELDPHQKAATLPPPGVANIQPLHFLHKDLSYSSLPLQDLLRPDLEAQIRAIAAREGVTLPRKTPQALTSFTTSTQRRSTSPSPSPSTSPAPSLSPAPALLHLAELSTGAVEFPKANRQLPPMDEEDKTTREPASAFEPSSNLTSLSVPANQKREDAVGGPFEEPPPSSQGLSREDVNAEEENTPSLRQDEDLPVQISPVSGVNHEDERATGSATSESPDRTGHVSHVHLTLSPKARDVPSSHTDALVKLPQKEFVLLRPSSSIPSSLDEGVGLCSPPEWYDTQRLPERTDTSTQFKTCVPQGRKTPTSTQSFTPRSVVSNRTLPTESPAVPVLLPYKPRGSEELFYIPQTEADVSSIDPSDTTMESSHTGSDDAVPPRFSSDVLGHRDAGVDQGVPIRHSEGIYSRRLKAGSFKMQERRHRGVSTDVPTKSSETQTPKPSPQAAAAFTRLRDQGTSPLHFPSPDQPEPNRVRFQPDLMDVVSDTANHHLTTHRSVPQRGGERAQEVRDPHPCPPAAAQSSRHSEPAMGEVL
ncbi:cell surface glycoprotein 1-like [Eleginops maclovinus]|uniref:cell surface glycoprotein 1-like n=1 Tax=Eleginops maclovinus TaxID=56733 RepID=UPI003080E40E